MKRFNNTQFLLVQSIFSQIAQHVRELDVNVLNAVLPMKSRNAFAGIGITHRGVLGDLNVPFTLLSLERLERDLRDADQEFTLREIWDRIDEVHARLYDELENRGMFFYIPMDRAKHFEALEPFGKRVSLKFPKLTEDIQEAEKCFACGRFTACVFHLMRIMEYAVQRMGKLLRVELEVEKENWQAILNRINGQIKLLDHKLPKTVLLTEIASHLYNVKVAWRNSVMHPKSTYTEEEAENLLKQVGLFIQGLARVV